MIDSIIYVIRDIHHPLPKAPLPVFDPTEAIRLTLYFCGPLILITIVKILFGWNRGGRRRPEGGDLWHRQGILSRYFRRFFYKQKRKDGDNQE